MPIKVVTEPRRSRTCLGPARPRSHTLGTRETHVSKRSRVEGEKRTEGGQNPTRAMPRRKEPDGGECGTGSEVSGSAVSVPRGRSPTRSSESRHSFQPPSRPSSRREVHERPNEATFDASPQMASVSSDRSAQRSAISETLSTLCLDRPNQFGHRVPRGADRSAAIAELDFGLRRGSARRPEPAGLDSTAGSRGAGRRAVRALEAKPAGVAARPVCLAATRSGSARASAPRPTPVDAPTESGATEPRTPAGSATPTLSPDPDGAGRLGRQS